MDVKNHVTQYLLVFVIITLPRHAPGKKDANVQEHGSCNKNQSLSTKYQWLDQEIQSIINKATKTRLHFTSRTPSSHDRIMKHSLNIKESFPANQTVNTSIREVNGSRDPSSSHLIKKRDVITTNNTYSSSNKNNTLKGENLERIQHSKRNDNEMTPPYYMGLGLHNYGTQIISKDNEELHQLSSLHVCLLLIAFSGAVLLLTINCVGILCCTRYFIRQKEPDTLLDTSFSTADSARRKWRYSSHSHSTQQDSIDMSQPPQYEEEIQLQSYPIKCKHGSIAKLPISSDSAICKNCNIWL